MISVVSYRVYVIPSIKFTQAIYRCGIKKKKKRISYHSGFVTKLLRFFGIVHRDVCVVFSGLEIIIVIF